MTLVDPTTYTDTIAAEGARISAIARGAPLDARVPHLRRWRLADVVGHLGGVHRWAAEVVERRSMSVGRRRGREEGDALIDWFDDGVAHLVATLEADEPDAPCPNFSPGSENTVLFWARRQAHETTMHRWDAESSVGRITPFSPAFATDGIDELFATFTRSRGRQVLTEPIALVTTDTGAEWVVSPAVKGGRIDVARPRSRPHGLTTIEGTAEALELALWHRLSFDEARLTITGRRDAAEAFVAGPVSP